MHYIAVTPLCLALAFPAAAQTNTDPVAPPPAQNPSAPSGEQEQVVPEDTAADIIVTGSRIRGTGPVGSAVISVGADQVVAQPTATVGEFLRKVPQIQGFGVDASSPSVSGGQGGTNTTRGSALNLRGVGPQATLTLIDGQRLSFSGVSSNYVDASAIPSIAIERIEVVPDGSSAVYGSDAVAGVVNFILRKDYEGLQARGRYGFADGYWLAQGSLLAGQRWGSGGVTLAYEYTRNDNLNGGERDYNRSDLREFGGSDLRNSQCSPGNIVVGGQSYAIPAGGVTPATANQLRAGTRNLCENLRFGDILPREERHRVYGYLEQEVGDRITLHAQGLYSARDYTSLAIQQGSTTNIVSLTVPNTNPFFVRPVGSTATSVTVEYDFTPLLGPIRQQGTTNTLFATGGIAWEVTDAWKVSLDGFYTSDFSEQNTRRPETATLTARLRSSDPTQAFNPFGGTNSPAVLDAIYSGLFNPYAVSRTRGGSIQADGPLVALPGGDVRLAIGGEFVRYTSDAGSRQGTAAAPSIINNPKLSRNQKSAYAELYVPVFGTANAAPGLERLDLSAAVRYDDYDDVGSTTNPKIGLNWSPVAGLLFKGSYGTSFRAPGLQDLPLLRTGASLTVATLTDRQSPTGSSVGLTLNAGNPDLTPETAETWSATVQVNPTQIRGLQLSATYFSLLYKDLIGFPPRTSQSLLDANYSFAVTRNPSDALIQSYLDRGLVINGVRPPVIAFLYDGSAQNLGSISTSGFDFDASYAFEAGASRFDIGVNGSYVLNYDFAVTQIATPVEQTGRINFPVEFRARAYAGWELNGFSVGATLNHVGGYSNTLVTPNQRVSSWNPIDLNVAYEFRSAGLLNGLSLGVNVTNLLDEDPPFVNIVGGFDPGQASAVGRLVAFTLAKKF
ncbi:iron complex outermembrane recepter protein [Sphingomonas guangdongensis]|uniref:Iron complex outermembrane recepter protein n=1 Tax=Sphingomonas guangdongensis TaxID=1141890 RepID=A0A285QD86_9SPHN|nr:TonB-dependent receptor [Sphingomonas guangdongensis]SOB79488.1 iron complex outermembrane recepter protein [Sphingomonas guangdongensis]